MEILWNLRLEISPQATALFGLGEELLRRRGDDFWLAVGFKGQDALLF